MSLFVCQKCNSIDNTATCSGDHSPTIYTAIVEDLNDFYPNMGGQDMDGHGDEDIVVNGVVWKKADEVKRLCCYCNTGKWHHEFERCCASEDELKVAMYSKYNMITPFDHETGSITKLNSSEEYQVVGSYDALHTIFREVFGKKHYEHMGSHTDSHFSIAYSVYKEDPMNFVPSTPYDDVDWLDRRSVGLWILDSLVYPDESESTSLVANFTHDFDFSNNSFATNLIQRATKLMERMTPKPHWKTMQSEEERKTKIAAAEAKRLRKQNRNK